MTRLEALAAQLDAPLLVTNLTNIQYLTGFHTSNGALLVRPGGEATLYTDFRYAEDAKHVPGVDAVVVNPGAWSHYSWAIRDALELLQVPLVEVHLSDIEHREEWRRFSVVAEIASHRVIGKGPDGYREALELLRARLEK